VFSEWIATIFTLNFGVSVAAVVLARSAGLQVMGAMGRGDAHAGVLLGVHDFRRLCRASSRPPTRRRSRSPGQCSRLLALAAMRFKPALVLYLGGLLVAGLATARGRHITNSPSNLRTAKGPRSDPYPPSILAPRRRTHRITAFHPTSPFPRSRRLGLFRGMKSGSRREG